MAKHGDYLVHDGEGGVRATANQPDQCRGCAKLRDLLRRVRGYYSAANAEWPAALRAEVDAAVEGGR